MNTNGFSALGRPPLSLSRRRFVTGFTAGGALAGLGLLPPSAQAGMASLGNPNVLSGTSFDLTIAQTPVNLTGNASSATTVNGVLPAPVLRWREGSSVTLRVSNRLPVPSSIHWHGVLLPFNMDGVPGLSFEGIPPGATFTYNFDVKQSGTYWYHSHSGFQEQTGLYGPIIIEPRAGERHHADRDYVVMLSDWSDDSPEMVLANLKKMNDFYNFNQPTALEFARDASQMGVQQALAKRKMWNRMRMNPTDLSDVTGHHYTYLINGASPEGNWTGLFRKGEKVRLRIINGSAQSIFDVRIPGLKLQVIAADGQDVEPVTVDEFRISTAETYDVLIEPSSDRAYTFFAQSIDRMGFARGTLAPREAMVGDIPEMDKPQWLSMSDMMGSMAMGGDMSGMQHGKSSMAPMDMGSSGRMPAPDGKSAPMKDGSMQMHGMPTMQMPPELKGEKMNSGMAGMGPSDMPMPKAHHARTEYGPQVDMHVDMPRSNIDDPGVGLRNNGRRVLTYGDLHTIGGPLDKREPGREVELHLTGNMNRYMWSFDGQKFSESKPLHFRHGERLRIVLVNDTMMPHPVHLHGMWSEMESPSGEFQVRKHTIMVQPAQRITYLVSADALGSWAYHCHLLYHMEAGMFRKVVVS